MHYIHDRWRETDSKYAPLILFSKSHSTTNGSSALHVSAMENQFCFRFSLLSTSPVNCYNSIEALLDI
ncbi:hypothetical protein V202x_40090 [Gimesia aquarii]|uniref:Uncharacterized protein n=1 Tax=Gimesia aquarii TaxID=2527964 RepID=A0A517WZC2_9PLAN|nr:hypothetical protein V202x_40090 [Gimesia aquarii]